VVEVPEELVESVHRRQMLVLVAEVVLAELSGGVALRLQQTGDRRVLRTHPDRRAGDPDLRQAGAKHALAHNERRPAGGAALLAIPVGEQHPFVGDAVDIRGAVAHDAVAVAAQVRHSDVVTPDDDDVGLRVVGHRCSLSRRRLVSSTRTH
jgi:hypothetical protein